MARRLLTIRALVVLIFALILARLAQLQVIEGERHRRLADENRIRVLRRLAPRGAIYDRNGEVLASSRPAFSISLVPEELDVVHRRDDLAAFAFLLEMEPEALEAALNNDAGPPRPPYEPITVHRDASAAVVARLEEHSVYLGGVNLLTDAVRQYPHGSLAAHVLGYVREISPRELERPEYAGYRPRDLIGKAGVERVAERALRGLDGGDQVEVDARGRRIRTLGAVPPTPGRDLWLTLDLEIQRAAEEALGGRAGAVVAMDPWTGGILALASHPTYDLNAFSGILSPEDWRRITGPGNPQHNRAIAACYPPGSVFKIVTAAAALERGVTSRQHRYHCPGAFWLGGWRLRCWKREGHGNLDFIRGFAQSCNVMFATLGRDAGPEALSETARRFGLGQPSGVDLPHEAAGLIPDPQWKRAARKQPWYPGDTAQMAIGQGDCLVTPLQVARAYSVIANGGYLVRPHLIARIEGYEDYHPSPDARPVGLRAETIAAIRDGMKAVVAPGGTAGRIASADFPIAGKTGTAEAARGEAHAWFAGFAPADQPRVVVVVVIEHAGAGSAAAAPVARHVLDATLLSPERRKPWTPPRPTIASAPATE